MRVQISLNTPTLLDNISSLDVNEDGRVDQSDVSALGKKVTSQAGVDAWRWNQARIVTALKPTDLNGSVLGALLVDDASQQKSPVGVQDALRSIRSLDTASLKAAGLPLVATLDYDDTLAKGNVFLPVMRALAARGLFTTAGDTALRSTLKKAQVPVEIINRGDVNARAVLLADLVSDKAGRVSVTEAHVAFGHALRGMGVDDAVHTVRELYTKGISEANIAPLKTQLFDGPSARGDSATSLIAGLKKQGIQPWIVSSEYDFITKAIAPFIGIKRTHVLGSKIEVDQSGAFATPDNPTAISKATLIRDVIGVPPITTFGNSAEDLTMIDVSLGNTYLVHPEKNIGMQDELNKRSERTSALSFG